MKFNHLKRGLVGSAILFCAMSGAAYAAAFTTEQAEKFVGCIAPLSKIAEEHDKDMFDGKDHDLVVDGVLKPYSVPLLMLKDEAPDVYSKVDKAAAGCGLKDAKTLAELADPIMAAYMAKKMGNMPAGMGNMPGLTPEMMAAMPPEAKKGFAVMGALQNVPQDDKDALTDELVQRIDVENAKAMPEGAFDPMQSHGSRMPRR